jgi:3-mercaptopyruvate sulfurtransferase SseA
LAKPEEGPTASWHFMKQLFNSLFVLAAVIGVFTIAACTDAAEPISISRSATPLPQPARADDGQEAPRISLEEAKKAFDEKSATFIDTHVKAAYDAGHIPGAINITVQDLEAKFNTIPKGKRIIAYCS